VRFSSRIRLSIAAIRICGWYVVELTVDTAYPDREKHKYCICRVSRKERSLGRIGESMRLKQFHRPTCFQQRSISPQYSSA
jgi:hypothetical protein